MSRTLAEITHEALSLPRQDQLRLARALLESSEASGDPGVEAAWEEEIDRRIQMIDSGLAKGRPFVEVLHRPEFWIGRVP